MTFKNKRAEMAWYVIGIILAIIVLLVSLIAVFKIGANTNAVGNFTKGTCESVFKGQCASGTGSDGKPTCPQGTQAIIGASCSDSTQICCTQ